MKIAILSSFLENIGGAEVVTLSLARELNADIYTTNISRDKIAKMGFSDVLPRIFSIGKAPKQAPFRHQVTLWRFRKLDLSTKYDFYIITGDWAISGAVNNKPNLWYIHSPLNEIWEFTDFIKKNIITKWKYPAFEFWVWLNRFLTKKYVEYVKHFVCNSLNTKNRLKKYYNKESLVINPPIDTDQYSYSLPKNYWLSVNRLAIHKRIMIQIEAFKKLPGENLIIVGCYEKGVEQFEDQKKLIDQNKSENIQILTWVNKEELIKLYSECKGFITTAHNEDFGITPVEAMASGKPVIACDEGGYKETVINGQTGILIDEINGEKLAEAIQELSQELQENPQKFVQTCQRRAKEFDTSVFVSKLKNIIQI